MGAPAPTFIPAPFAIDAAAGYINFPIPESASGPANLASWSQGFPEITMQPEVGGGLPPFGQDFNGILLTLSGHTYAQQAGQPYTFSASFAGTISGYAAGAILGMADGTGTWFNTVAGNSNNPDTAATPSGWVPGISYGITYLTGLTGGTVTPTPAQTRRQVIELSGTLTANLTIILPPTLQQWLIVNNTTGSFTTTVQTATGSGVTVPQGGPSSPIGVWGDGANIYPSTAPLSVPISQAATPLTLAERTSAGYLFATYFNQSSSPTENPAIGSVAVQSTANDGYFRFASLSYFTSQIFVNAALTGAPTAPTQAVSDNSTKIATTAFVKALMGGSVFTFRTGQANIVGGNNQRVNFATSFPTACLGVIASVPIGGYQPGCASWDVNGFTLNGSGQLGTQTATYFAWGN